MWHTTSRPRRRRFSRPACRARWLIASLSASSALLAGCGGGRPADPTLARADAAPVATLARKIAVEGPCAQVRDIRLLQSRAIALINTGRVPAELQDSLMSGVNTLAGDAPPCVPPVPTTPAPKKPSPPAPHQPKEHHHHGPGKKKH